MNKKLICFVFAIASALSAMNAQATVFQGQNANGTFDPTCTVNESANQCVMYWDAVDGIEILNNWNIGVGFWDANASAGSAQAIAAAAGYAATGLTGWVLPTGDGTQPAGPQNQYLSIWQQTGGSVSGLQSQFSGFTTEIFGFPSLHTMFWSSQNLTEIETQQFSSAEGVAWLMSIVSSELFIEAGIPLFLPDGPFTVYNYGYGGSEAYAHALAVYNGEISDASAPPPPVPLPASAWLLISSIGGLAVFARKRKA